MAHAVQEQVNAIRWAVIRLELPTCDFHVLGRVKTALKFESDSDVQQALAQWFRWQSKESFPDEIRGLSINWTSV
jgi:hypothetical protein